MQKVRNKYSDEFIKNITEEFLSGGLVRPDHMERVRNEIAKVRQHDYCAIFLEMFFALRNVHFEDSLEASERLMEVVDMDELIKLSLEAELDLSELIINYLDSKPKAVAKAGGQGRAAKFASLKAETIRLFNEGSWKSVPTAALAITPKIVAHSKPNNGNLLPTTTKPLEWLREHVKAEKSKPS